MAKNPDQMRKTRLSRSYDWLIAGRDATEESFCPLSPRQLIAVWPFDHSVSETKNTCMKLPSYEIALNFSRESKRKGVTAKNQLPPHISAKRPPAKLMNERSNKRSFLISLGAIHNLDTKGKIGAQTDCSERKRSTGRVGEDGATEEEVTYSRWHRPSPLHGRGFLRRHCCHGRRRRHRNLRQPRTTDCWKAPHCDTHGREAAGCCSNGYRPNSGGRPLTATASLRFRLGHCLFFPRFHLVVRAQLTALGPLTRPGVGGRRATA